jgi:iron complex outermembrane receptor protein
VTSTGLEARFAWRPVEFLALDLQAGYNSTKFDAHLDSAGNDVSGNRVPFVPEYTIRTGATFDLGGGFYTHANVSAFGKTAYNEQNTSTFVQGTYAVVNMEVGYRRESWIVTLYGRNLFEEDYYQFLNPEIFAGSPGAPQRFGVRVGYTY